MNFKDRQGMLAFRRSKRAASLTPLSRGLLVGLLFTTWIIGSYLIKGKPWDGQDDQVPSPLQLILGQGAAAPRTASAGAPAGFHVLRAPRRTLLGDHHSDAEAGTDHPLQHHQDHHETSTEGDEGVADYDDQVEDRNGSKCLRPAIEQFPRPIIGKTGRRYGGLIFHILIAVYMFIGLAVICDDYFVPALDRICEVLEMPPDVAGATFMAAGSSGPELATAVIGVFVAKDDIGISGVIGSAIFNITLVIAVCSLAANQVLYLNWYPVVRDCTCYLISIAVLLGTIANELISWPEALLFLVLYVVYCVAMAFSPRIEKIVTSKVTVPQSWTDAKQSGADAANKVVEDGTEANDKVKVNRNGGDTVEIPLSPMGGKACGVGDDPEDDENHREPEDDPRSKPDGRNKLELAKWAVMYPLHTVAHYTIPDCRKKAWANAYVATFILAIIWISFFSYFMVWMITVIGFTLGIPDTVMGMTFIAAGVSVPDALSGVAVVREGHGNMAVSNAIGSNVFDILVCLGLPWFLDTAIVNPGKYVKVQSKGLLYSTLSLFSTVVFLITASHFNGWKLDRKFGILLLVWYFIFSILASLYELNIFGDFNLPECESEY